MLDYRQIALRHSLHCFFNSYIRDMNPSYDESNKTFNIQVEDSILKLHVQFYSLVGVHQFLDSLDFLKHNHSTPVGFLEAAEIICKGSKLFPRLLNSIHNIELSLKMNGNTIQDLYSENFNFLKAEQGLLIGHNFHPSPKSRDEFTDQDLIQYAPEFQAKFKISWLLVNQEIIHEERSVAFAETNWQKELFQKDVPDGFIPFPIHPWQKQILIKDQIIQKYIQKGLIINADESKQDWFATSSMRSLYSPSSRYMVKFSVSVRMTNSLRHLQEKEVGRGMQIQDAFHTTAGKCFSQKFPQFHVLHEPAYMAIKGPDNEVLPQTIVLLRENPFHGNDKVVVLATLTQNHPLNGKNLISHCLKRYTGTEWFKAFIENAFMPLLMAQADYGIMLGAHQQNLLIKLKDGLPVGAFFRDCQGTGFSEMGKYLMLNEIQQKEKFLAHVVPQDAALSLFTYYLVINSVLNTISAVALASGESEETFIKMLQNALVKVRAKVKDSSVIDHLLTSQELNQKGNFRCSLESINENTTTNPLSIYNNFKNPLYMGYVL